MNPPGEFEATLTDKAIDALAEWAIALAREDLEDAPEQERGAKL